MLDNKLEQISAMKSLLKCYKGEIKLPYCPLCCINSIKCDSCVWVKYTGNPCMHKIYEVTSQYNKHSVLRNYTYDVKHHIPNELNHPKTDENARNWAEKRIIELKDWINKETRSYLINLK